MTSKRALMAMIAAATVAAIGGMCTARAQAADAAQARSQAPPPPDPADALIQALIARVEQAALQADRGAYLALLAGSADTNAARDFVTDEFRAGATRAVVQERERIRESSALPGSGYSLTVDAFIEFGDRARVATWQIDIRRAEDQTWRIAGQRALSSVDNIYRLKLNAAQQFDAKQFTVFAEDLELTLEEGTVFTVDTDQGTTGLVLIGRGEMRFHPSPQTEVEQVRLFGGEDTLTSKFDAVFVRVGSFNAHADRSQLVARTTVDPKDARRAAQIFREESVKSFGVDLADLTRDQWSLLPSSNDFLAEIRTRRFGTLTYVGSSAEPEDISFFERRRHRNIAVYASKGKLASRGRFYNEDDLAPYDVLDYDIDLTALPERQWIDGRATMKIRVRAAGISQLTIKLADTLTVRSVVSDRFGRLFNLRVSNQNTILVNLPSPIRRGTEMTIRIDYSGRLEPQAPERETLGLTLQDVPTVEGDPSLPKGEPNYLYSNASYWYPQSMVSDYATATMQITVPGGYSCVASGEVSSASPEVGEGTDKGQARKLYFYTAARPLKYLAFLVTRLTRVDRWTIDFDKRDVDKGATEAGGPSAIASGSGGAYRTLDLIVDTNPRQAGRGKELAERAVDVVQFYESIIGDSPYSAFTLALIENTLPGGHSPGYFAVLNQPLANAGVSWRTDPAAFSNYPEFFLAHEVAHQWWGQAVGGRNYHEQWLSEGFSQYFAALYAQHFRGQEVFSDVMRQMSRWAADKSDQGPVYLGYRIGHVRNEGRAFRAVIYNKGAVVLHMLRQLVGDDAFFSGVRRFYAQSRYTKASTDDFRLAMEAETGRSLERFFDRWIYNSTLPQLAFSYRVEPSEVGQNGVQSGVQNGGQDVVLHFEQTGELFDLPVSVTLQYADRRTVTVMVPVTDRTVDFRVPLQGTLRQAEINRDDGLLADMMKN